MRTQNQVCHTIPLAPCHEATNAADTKLRCEGFFGFSYGYDSSPCLLTVAFLITTLLLKSVFGCQSKSQLLSDFKKMRSTYNTRYVRVYGDCPNERANFLDDIIEAAYETGMGVFALVWLGYVIGFQGIKPYIERLSFVRWDASDKSWKTRMSHIKSTISNNPLAPYVIRSVDVGSEPLLDQVCWRCSVPE